MRALRELVAQVGHGDVRAVLFEEPINAILPGAVTLWAGQADHVELGRSLAEREGAVGMSQPIVTKHEGSASQSSRDSGAAARSSAAWILLPRPRALVWYVRRRMSPRLLGPPTVGRSDRMAKA
jgi:hypothetical protein